MKPGDFRGHEIEWRHYVTERRLPTFTRVPDRHATRKDTSMLVWALVVAGLLLMVLT